MKIEFVQFQSRLRLKQDEAWVKKYDFYLVDPDITEIEFYDEDEGEDYYVDVITFYKHDKSDIDSAQLDGLDYFSLELIVNCDENNKPLWNVA